CGGPGAGAGRAAGVPGPALLDRAAAPGEPARRPLLLPLRRRAVPARSGGGRPPRPRRAPAAAPSRHRPPGPLDPLPAQTGPIAAVFSADILEAAMRGIPAWVHAPGAPGWVAEQWERYGMRRAGTEPTPAPELGTDEPARLIAQILEGGA